MELTVHDDLGSRLSNAATVHVLHTVYGSTQVVMCHTN